MPDKNGSETTVRGGGITISTRDPIFILAGILVILVTGGGSAGLGAMFGKQQIQLDPDAIQAFQSVAAEEAKNGEAIANLSKQIEGMEARLKEDIHEVKDEVEEVDKTLDEEKMLRAENLGRIRANERGVRELNEDVDNINKRMNVIERHPSNIPFLKDSP